MAKTKKTDGSSPAKPRAAAPRRRTPKAASTPAAPVPAPDAGPTDLASVSATQPIAVASDMSAPGTPEGIVDVSAATATPAPTHDEIAVAAYHRYLQRGGGHGMDFEDWLEAERTLRAGR